MRPPRKTISTITLPAAGHRQTGAWGEAMGEAFLLGLDLHVFKNVADCGPADFVVATPDFSLTIPIDVKVAVTKPSRHSNIYAAPLTSAQRELGVQALWITPTQQIIWPSTNTRPLTDLIRD